MADSDALEIARINAALVVLQGTTYSNAVQTEAEAYLLRQFREQQVVPNPQDNVSTSESPICGRMRPGRTTKLADALHCLLPKGHAGECDYK